MIKDITIVISTYNRETVIRETLEAMTKVDRAGMNVEWIVVDNASTDNTSRVLNEYSNKLPLKSLFEERAGKNFALNKALDTCDLKEIVVFCDDDVSPEKEWLRTIASASERWPEHSVFGGRIEPVWPDSQPVWASSFILEMGFAKHDYGEEETPYREGIYPFGPNMWVRRKLFDEGNRYNTTVGPRPKNRIMGGETTFLKSVWDKGFPPVYIPSAVVRHRISASEVVPWKIVRRAIRHGRGCVYIDGIPNEAVLRKSRLVWSLWQKMKYAKITLNMILGYIEFLCFKNLDRMVFASRTHGIIKESRYVVFHK